MSNISLTILDNKKKKIIILIHDVVHNVMHNIIV